MASDIVQQVRSITESITVRTVLSTENTSRDRKSVLVNEPGDKQNSQPLPRNVKLLGAASLLNDIASEMIFPLMPQFLITVLGGNRFHLGIIEGGGVWAGSRTFLPPSC